MLARNPFLDPLSTVGGRIAEAGQPLFQIRIPEITTLIHKTEESSGNLFMVNISDTIQHSKATREELIPPEEDVGLELNLNLYGTEPSDRAAQLNPAEVGKQRVGRTIPTTIEEVRNVLHLVSGQRKPRRSDPQNAVFSVAELKIIARNLGLPTNLRKEELARRIHEAVSKVYSQE